MGIPVIIVPMDRPDAHSLCVLIENLAAAGFDTAVADQDRDAGDGL